jgi:hemoglobin/transferrin/lactoferrin receptor protein
MKKWIMGLPALFMYTYIHAQITDASDTIPVKELEEVVISANKFAEKRKNIVQKIEVLSSKTIARVNAQNTGDLLMNTGNVFVQKSQQGGSSPVLRGFEASRILLVIDGIRMNNAIYRSGHLQNIITVDQNTLERVEILFGPASTLYGSDALGGIIHLQTKSASLSTTEKPLIKGTAFARYSSVNNENTMHTDISIGGKKWGWFQSYNYSRFGDLHMGSRDLHSYPDFGIRPFYITMINGKDAIVRNSNSRSQRFSGYEQWDMVQKLLFQPNKYVSHELNFQFSNSTDIPRYDRLQDIRNGNLRFAEWFYGPQKRTTGAYQLHLKKAGFFDQARLLASWQDIEESRQTREYLRIDRFDSRREHVQVGGYTFDLRKVWNQNELTVGTDGQFNWVRSRADRTNLSTGVRVPLDSRYPDGKNNMHNLAIYAQHLRKFNDGKIILNEGLRLQQIWLHSSIENNTFFQLPFTRIQQNNLAFTGNLGVVFLPNTKNRLALGLASGFRAPNIDDLAKIFESSTSARQVVFPNPNIRPEHTFNLDFTYSKTFNKGSKIELTGYYTQFRNALVKAPFSINGKDSIVYDGVLSQVLANQNKNRAYLYGCQASFTMAVSPKLRFMGTVHYTVGRFRTDPNVASAVYKKQPGGNYELTREKVSSKPLDHIPPLMGKWSALYEEEKWYAECFVLFNGWKRLEQYNADGEDNPQYATADGTPAWATINWRAGLQANEKIQLQFQLENLLDQNYRTFASGLSAPGRNVSITVRTSF